MSDAQARGPETAPSAVADAAAWRREHAISGITSGLILAHVESVRGRAGVESVLELAGMSGREADLRNEDAWFSFAAKIRLWDAAVRVTGDADVAEHAGEAGLDLTVGIRLKQAMRALGSPALLLRNIARVSSKFNCAHTLELVEREPHRVRLAYRDVSGVGYHRYDCQCTIGLLRMVPPLFGLPPARVTHPVCGAAGDDHCEFEVTWTERPRSARRTAAAGAIVAGALGAAGALIATPLLAAGVATAGGTACAAAAQAVIAARRRIRALELQVRELAAESEVQLQSLSLLSSELRLDKALARIAETARTTVGGAQFALLVCEGDGMRVEAHSGIPPRSLSRLAEWAHARRSELRRQPIVLDDLGSVAQLRPIAGDPELPLGSLCAVALTFADRMLGVLIALSPGATVFFPKDVRALEIYAGHSAIALWNARLVEQLELHAAEDSLTGLANRRAFDRACAAELDRLARHGGAVSLVLFDLDHFKQINDTYGHPIGDQTLVAAARLLREVVRAHDIVARLGGEEFGLLLPGAMLEEAHEIAERTRTLLATIELPHGPLSCSAGVAVAHDPGATSAELLALADRALYEAKRQGRGRTVPAIG